MSEPEDQDHALTPALLLADEPAPWDDSDIVAGVGQTAAQIRSEKQAAWAMATLAALNATMEELDAEADVWIEAIREQLVKRRRPLQAEAEFCEAQLERWAVATRDLTGTKTFPLPFGTVETRETRPEVVVDDEAALIAWAVDTLKEPEYSLVVKETQSARISELRKIIEVVVDSTGCRHILYGGDPVPGVTLTDGHISATVKPTA